MGHRSPRELIEIYWDRVYNAGEVELIREVCADPIIRHDPGFVTPLSHEEQITRVQRSVALGTYFTHRVLHADDRFVTSVWNMVTRDGRDIKLCGIEVFEAAEGRFTRCWNSSYESGWWGEDGDGFDPAKLLPPALIASPAEITADWLQRAFAAGGVVDVQRLAMEPVVSPIGHGTTSTTVHVRASYNTGHITAPRSAICKIGRWSGEPGATSPHDRERHTYALFGDNAKFRIPRLYYGASDDTGLCNILIEDLSETTRAGDQIAGCSIADAEAVVRELALFHRSSLGRADLLSLDWLIDPKRMLPNYARGVGVLRDWLSNRIDEADLALIERFGTLAETWLDIAPVHPSLIHADPRVDNILFEDGPEGTRACLIDWQNLGKGDPQYDVAYFLSGSISIDDRRTCERDLIAQHTALLAEVDPTCTLEAATEAYRRNIVSGLWLTVVAAAFIERNEHNVHLLLALIGRNVAAVRDWDGLAAIG